MCSSREVGYDRTCEPPPTERATEEEGHKLEEVLFVVAKNCEEKSEEELKDRYTLKVYEVLSTIFLE